MQNPSFIFSLLLGSLLCCFCAPAENRSQAELSPSTPDSCPQMEQEWRTYLSQPDQFNMDAAEPCWFILLDSLNQHWGSGQDTEIFRCFHHLSAHSDGSRTEAVAGHLLDLWERPAPLFWNMVQQHVQNGHRNVYDLILQELALDKANTQKKLALLKENFENPASPEVKAFVLKTYEKALMSAENKSQAEPSISAFSPDTSLNKQLFLLDQPSVEKYLGNLSPMLDADADLPDAYFQPTAQDSVYLRAVVHPGSAINTLSLLEVGKKELLPDSIVLHPMQDIALVTENGIKLGMSREEVVAKKGTAHQITSSPDRLSYRITDGGLAFLQKHNAPIYIATYWFEKGLLVKFEFGLEYP